MDLLSFSLLQINITLSFRTVAAPLYFCSLKFAIFFLLRLIPSIDFPILTDNDNDNVYFSIRASPVSNELVIHREYCKIKFVNENI